MLVVNQFLKKKTKKTSQIRYLKPHTMCQTAWVGNVFNRLQGRVLYTSSKLKKKTYREKKSTWKRKNPSKKQLKLCNLIRPASSQGINRSSEASSWLLLIQISSQLMGSPQLNLNKSSPVSYDHPESYVNKKTRSGDQVLILSHHKLKLKKTREKHSHLLRVLILLRWRGALPGKAASEGVRYDKV